MIDSGISAEGTEPQEPLSQLQGCRAAGLQGCGTSLQRRCSIHPNAGGKGFFLHSFHTLKEPGEGTTLYSLQQQRSQPSFILPFMSKHDGVIYFQDDLSLYFLSIPRSWPSSALRGASQRARPQVFEGRKDTQSPGFISDPSSPTLPSSASRSRPRELTSAQLHH